MQLQVSLSLSKSGLIYTPCVRTSLNFLGLTVGFVVVPQAMAYAILAELGPEYGLYTSFTGAALYWLFGTSKDIVIGVSLGSRSHLSEFN